MNIGGKTSEPRLKLSAEVQCWPLWLSESEESTAENVDPAELGPSNEHLRAARHRHGRTTAEASRAASDD